MITHKFKFEYLSGAIQRNKMSLTVAVIKDSKTYHIPQLNAKLASAIGSSIDMNIVPQQAILALDNGDPKKISIFEMPDLLEITCAVRREFENYLPPAYLCELINTFINSLFVSSFWKEISSHKDCGFVRMIKRRFTYHNSTDNLWKETGKHFRTLNTYPNEFCGEIKEDMIVADRETRKNEWSKIQRKAIEIYNAINVPHKAYKNNVDIKELEEYKDSNYNTVYALESQFYPQLNEYKYLIGLFRRAGLTKMAIKLMCVMPLTHKYCGVIKCKWFWDEWNSLIHNRQLKNFIIYYSMYILKLEEIKSYYSVPHKARFVFSLDEAALFSENIGKVDIDKHPLIHLMEPLSYKRSYLPYFLEGERRINTMDTFIERLSIATGGLLDDIDLREYNAVLSGSILVPCVATNPLEKRFNVDESSTAFRVYLECYYPSYRSVEDSEFEGYVTPEQTEQQYQAQKHEDMNNCKHTHKYDIDKAVAYNILSDLDISIHTDTFDNFKIQAYSLFERMRDKLTDKRIYMRRIQRAKTFKYSIYGAGILRPIDLFWITKSPETFVDQFHLGVVRMFWNGSTIRIMQSALAALLTGINHDYRWMSCSKSPAIPIIKYVQRGYTTPLNSEERSVFANYLAKKEEWQIAATDLAQIYVPARTDNIIFRPDHSNFGIRYGLKPMHKITSHKYDTKISKRNAIWIDTTVHIGKYEVPYYNENRNSVGCPTIEMIDNFISESEHI